MNKGLKLEILRELLTQQSPFYYREDGDIMEFLLSIWDLRAMPDTDGRYKDAYGDIIQHIINNDDWDYEYLFIERLNLLESNDIFIKFLNRIIHPDTRGDEKSIMAYYYLLQPYLKRADLGFKRKAFKSNELPIYEVEQYEENSISTFGLKDNSIPFIVDFRPNGHSNRIKSHRRINKFPCFVLAFNYGWNDYKIKSTFHLFFHRDNIQAYHVGEVKIIHESATNASEVVPAEFTNLTSDFCSLGQSSQYYKTLKELFPKEFEDILWALRDSAFFLENRERFEQNSNFKNSLIRENTAERLLREAKYLLYDYDLENLYSFSYKFNPKFAENNLNVDFNFKDSDFAYDRIYGIIGKNGTGKTQLITSLPLDISKKNDTIFKPKAPLFSKVIAVSYSSFDSFELPRNNAKFNYNYCGLRNEDNKLLTEEELLLRFHETRLDIEKLGRIGQWIDTLKNFIDKDSLSQFMGFEMEHSETTDKVFTFDIEAFSKVVKHLSSGQSIILFIITELIAKIRFDSLILYDEPETHLHPNAISQLVNTIYHLVHQFKSYCIITTHSPLIIQEIISKNVYVVEREGYYSSIRRIGIESFGENLSILSEEVFGNREIPKQYQIILKEMVDSRLTYEQIKERLEYGQIPLSINASIYLKSLLNDQS
ncbi:AAA family ATPase [Maribacter sp. Hel_I_7]|uniref:AbiJ-related protein n=1 Tax=Maribacter sp. Hel_I_7 TaxID=1249997 RepID=UPI0004791535|nr:AAA family ATPase [Maribacter sp. Hel_I_7]